MLWKFQTNENLREQIAFNHSSDTEFQDFMNLYKKSTAEPYSVLVTDTTFEILHVSGRIF